MKLPVVGNVENASKLLERLRARTRAYVEANVVGGAVLTAQRVRGELKQRVPGWWKHEHLSPPLSTSPRLKQLISRHYLRGRHADAHGKVAWVTSGAPVEFLEALGFHLHYPENHGAVCGIRRVGEALCGAAEDEGYSRDICSYARTDFGMVHSGETPVGRVAPPNLLLCCTNICQTVLYWYQVLAEHFDVPLVLIDTPFVYDEARDHALTFVEEQLSEAIEVAERVAGQSLAPKKLERVLERSQQAVQLWLEVIERGRARPTPITAFDEFIHMAPIVEMRGKQFTVDYYRALAAALDERIEKGVGALKNERKRLIWDNLPIWYQVRPLAEQLAEQGVALVASTYTNAWGELAALIDPQRPLASMAKVYTYPILNRGTGHKLETIKRMVEFYQADGVLLHSDRSCKPYSIGQIDQQQRLAEDVGVPALLLEADHNDPRAFSDEQTRTRLAAFIEMLS